MTQFVRIAVNVPQVSGLFDYHLPVELEGKIQPGSLVVVPFGQQKVQGIVVEMLQEAEVMETKAVGALLDALPVVTLSQIQLAKWMADETLSNLPACLELFLPPGLSQLSDTLFWINPSIKEDNPANSSLQQRILALLQTRGGLRGRQLDNAFPHQNWKAAALGLIKKGLILSRPVLPPPSVHPKTIRTAQLSAPLDKAVEVAEAISKSDATLTRRRAALEYLNTEAVPTNVAWVYAANGCNLEDLKLLAEAELIILSEAEIFRNPLEKIDWVPTEPPHLTFDQEESWEKLQHGLRGFKSNIHQTPYLLHGVTGSGKTEIYLRAVEETLKLGKQAIILVPEISLTPQTVRRFAARFPGQIGLIHSKLSPGERYDTWRRARDGKLPIIIGPRSALFCPLDNLGLIVIDECHDGSYDQEDNPPYYHTVEIAIQMAQINKALLVLGSATPGIDMLYKANLEGWERLELPLRILAHRKAVQAQIGQRENNNATIGDQSDALTLPLPPVKVVDMRDELKAGNRSIFSRELQSALEKVLKARQQAILFLNRRGSSTYVFCRECGYVLRCPRCDLPLTYHEDQQKLLCHTCGYTRLMPSKCPQCSSNQIRQYGTGTEGVEKTLHELFPDATTLRWDAETTRQKGSHEIILSHFANHRADILIGTQMLTKGLDLPLVTLVGVVLADVGINLPDFRAGERAFQLLTQVAGRAGRSPLGGRAIIQTFQPEHYAIQAASHHDYMGFYRQELELRKKMGYPPFSRLVSLEFRNENNGKAEELAVKSALQIQTWIQQGGFKATEIIGPVPCFFARRAGMYRWQVILRGPNPINVIRGKPLSDARVVIDPTDLL
jgi:primosomal protein N' (replication factor Y)